MSTDRTWLNPGRAGWIFLAEVLQTALDLAKAVEADGGRVRQSGGRPVARLAAQLRVERFDRRTIEPFEPFENLQKILQIFAEFWGSERCKGLQIL